MFDFKARDNFINNINTLVKWVLLITVYINVLLVKNYLIYIILIIILLLFSRINLKLYFKLLIPMLFLFFSYLIFFLILYTITYKFIVILFFKFYLLTSYMIFLLLSSGMDKVILSFEQIFYFLKIFKISPRYVSSVLFLAINSIDILFLEYKRIKKAQIVRGVDISKNKVNNFLMIIVPLVDSVLKREEDLAISLMVKRYSLKNTRTQIKEKLKVTDVIILFLIIILFLLSC